MTTGTAVAPFRAFRDLLAGEPFQSLQKMSLCLRTTGEENLSLAVWTRRATLRHTISGTECCYFEFFIFWFSARSKRGYHSCHRLDIGNGAYYQ